MKNKRKCFVTFLSPGSFVSESTTKEIEDWCSDKAIEMVDKIVERHGAKPYGFYFTTRELMEKDFDSVETERSGIFHLGGKILSLEDIKSRGSDSDSILISNMECNGWGHVIENNNSWKMVSVFYDEDIFLEV